MVDDKVPVCRSREGQLGNAGDDKRVKNTGDEREQKKNNDCRFQLVPDDGGNSACFHTFATPAFICFGLFLMEY
jgi:hypothetical protein